MFEMFREDRQPAITADLVEPVERYFRQEPVSFRLPIDVPAPRGVVIVNSRPDHTPLILGLSLLGLFALLAFLATRK